MLALILLLVLVATPVMADTLPPPPTEVGGEVVPIDGAGLIAYWGVLALIVAAGGIYLTRLIRRRIHN